MTEPTEKSAARFYYAREHKITILRAMIGFLSGAAFFCSVIVAFHIGPRIENFLWPVVPVFVIQDIEHTPSGDAIISGVLYKSYGREHCYLENNSAYTTDGTQPHRRIEILFEVPRSGGQHQWLSHPAEAQAFGPWRLYRPDPPIGALLVIEVTHRCHALWSVTQELYSGLSEDFFPSQTTYP